MFSVVAALPGGYNEAVAKMSPISLGQCLMLRRPRRCRLSSVLARRWLRSVLVSGGDPDARLWGQTLRLSVVRGRGEHDLGLGAHRRGALTPPGPDLLLMGPEPGGLDARGSGGHVTHLTVGEHVARCCRMAFVEKRVPSARTPHLAAARRPP